MKKITSLNNKSFLVFWILYHLGIVAFFALLMLVGKRSVNIDADLFNMLPKPAVNKTISEADQRLTELTGQNVFILVSNPDAEKCKQVAETVFDQLKDSTKFKSISLRQNLSSADSLMKLLDNYKYNLLDEETITNITENGGEAYSQEVLERLFSGFFPEVIPVSNNDPFMISGKVMMHYAEMASSSGIKMTVNEDGMMTSTANGKTYIMIRGILSKEGAALASSGNAVVKIHEVCDPIEGTDGTHFVYSGTPFHSYKSSSNASREITIISSISLAVVLIILLLIFKRPHPIFWSIISIGISVLIAICSTLIVFKKMHVLTLVFGTSLIGSCIDYSLHYFINWKANTDLHNGQDIRNYIFKGLLLSLISTCMCYIVLLFAPFNLIKQMAIFSTTGIISTFLTAVCVYPFIKVPVNGKKIHIMKFIHTPSWYNKKLVGRIVITSLFVVSISIIIIFWFIGERKVKAKKAEMEAKNPNYITEDRDLRKKLIDKLHIHNDLQSLYKMEGAELANEKEAFSVLQYNPSGWFIVSGNSPEEVLRTEEKITEKLKVVNTNFMNSYSDEEKARRKLNHGFMCTSMFIPSLEKQKRSYEAVGKLVPYTENHLAQLSEYFDFTNRSNFRSDYRKKKGTYFKISDIFPQDETEAKKASIKNDELKSALRGLLQNSWLGKLSDGRYYSVILPASVIDLPSYKKIAKDVSEEMAAENQIEFDSTHIEAAEGEEVTEDKNDSVFFVLKVAEMNTELDNLTFTILIAFIIVYVVLFILLKFFYSWKQTFKITSVPLLIILVTVAIFYAFDINIEFFSVTGMILVFGLGLDYIIYMIENEKRKEDSDNARLEPFAIALSFTTTAVSFGALALSQFIPVHMMGLAIFIGLSTAYCSTFFYQRAEI